MERLSEIYSTVADLYGAEGIALAAIILAAFAIEIYYYAGIYAPIAGFRLQKRKKICDAQPPVSVIVPIFSENLPYLDEGLVELLTQDYDRFEVVAVYVGNDENFYADLSHLRNLYPHLKTTQIDYSPRYPVSAKMALNVGIKAATNEHVIMTTADASPASKRWLSLMAKGFMYGDIVLGYCGLESKKGFFDHLFREYRLTESMAWIASAIRRRPFGASRHNLGFTKTLYFGVRGFNHLNMNVGEDDLFIRRIATADNVAPVLSPRAACTEKRWGGFSWWYNRTLYRGATRQFYPFGAKNFIAFELVARILFFAAAICAIVMMPPEYKIAAAAMLVLRYGMVAFVMLRVSRRLGESGIVGRHVLYDIAEPFVRAYIRLSLLKRNKNAWR